MRTWRRALVTFCLVGIGACFRTHVELPQGKHAFAVAAADVNRDGRSDLIASADFGAELGDTLSVRLGLGDGRFGEPKHHPLPVSARAEDVLVADLDGDGLMDAVTANTSLYTVGIFRGKGDGDFDPVLTLNSCEEPKRVAAADFDLDGSLDLVVACRDDGGQYLNLLLNLGDGHFQAPVQFSDAPGSVAFDVAVGDVNDDALPDVVTAGLATGPKLRVHLNRGAGRLEPQPFFEGGLSAVELLDLNHDGKLDIAAIEHTMLRVLLGRGDGTFQPSAEHPIGGEGGALVVADFDRDTNLDLAVTRPDDNLVRVIRAPCTKNAPLTRDFRTGSRPVSLAVSDFDGDGWLDLVTANRESPGSLSVLSNDGHW